MIVTNRAVQGRIRDIYPVIILSFNGQNGICCKKDSHNKRVRKHIIDKYAPRTNFYQFITVLLLITTGVVGKVLEEKMRVLNWALDAQKTMHGKIISVVLSVALIFSFSNFFYGDNAFAEEQKVETNTEVTTEPAQSEPVVTETEKKSEEPQSKAPDQESTETSQTEKATASEDQLSTQAEGDTDVNAGTEENSDQNGEPKANFTSTVENLTATWDSTANVISITGSGMLTKTIFQKFAFTDENGNEIKFADWEPIVQKVVLSGEELTIAGEGTHDQPFRDNNTLGKQKGGYALEISNINEIPRNGFLGAHTLKSCEVKNVGSIELSSFYLCDGLLEAKIVNAEKMGPNIFTGCAALESLTIEKVKSISQDITGNYAGLSCSNLKSLNLKDIDTIGNYAFRKTPSVTSVTINNVSSIGEQAFVSCYGIKSLSIEDVNNVGINAFASCKGIESASLSGVDTIGQYAFYNCTSLQTVNMTEIDKIANYAFWNCSNLQTIDSLSNVKTSIGGFAFYGCSSLTGLTVADLTKMGYIGSNDEIMKRVQAILAGKFNLDNAENINELGLEEGWAAGEVGKSSNWNAYDNGTQIMEQARWADENAGVAEVKVDAYYTGEKQMDYIFVADLSASMAQLGNAEDNNARFYDMQSKLMDMTGKLLNTPGYDCRVAIVSFGGEHNNNATQNSSGFLSQSGEVTSYIKGLAPLNENTDYGLGMQKALELAQGNTNRNTVVVFLSDGAPNRNTSGDQDGTIAAQAIRDLKVPIYGVLHSPSASQASSAENKMEAVCDYVYKSTDTASFGQAMNSAFAAAYGDNTVMIPVNARDFNINNLNASAGTVEYNDGVITWTLSGMPFTQHTLTYNMNLTEENANRVGTYEYGLNNGNAHFGDTGASAGLSLSLSRTVADPANPDPTPAPEPDPAPNPGDGGATTPDDGGATIPDGGGATTPAAAPATPAAAPAAPAATPAAPAVVIPDEENPLAAPEQEIADDENPLAAFDHEECWVHWFMIAGIILTIIYGAVVVIRRTRNTKHIDKMEKDLIGTTDESTVTVGSAHHSHA